MKLRDGRVLRLQVNPQLGRRRGANFILSSLVAREEIEWRPHFILERRCMKWWDWSLLNAFKSGHVRQLNAQQKLGEGSKICAHCTNAQSRCLDTCVHFLFPCSGFTSLRSCFTDDICDVLKLPVRRWHRMPMELRLAQVVFPFEKEMQATGISKEDKEALFGRRMTVIGIFVKFLSGSGRFDGWSRS